MKRESETAMFYEESLVSSMVFLCFLEPEHTDFGRESCSVAHESVMRLLNVVATPQCMSMNIGARVLYLCERRPFILFIVFVAGIVLLNVSSGLVYAFFDPECYRAETLRITRNNPGNGWSRHSVEI